MACHLYCCKGSWSIVFPAVAVQESSSRDKIDYMLARMFYAGEL